MPCGRVNRNLTTSFICCVFFNLVDQNDAPGYYRIIKNPMDFGRIKRKLEVCIKFNMFWFLKNILWSYIFIHFKFCCPGCHHCRRCLFFCRRYCCRRCYGRRRYCCGRRYGRRRRYCRRCCCCCHRRRFFVSFNTYRCWLCCCCCCLFYQIFVLFYQDGEYESYPNFYDDMMLIKNNCYIYNPEGHVTRKVSLLFMSCVFQREFSLS